MQTESQLKEKIKKIKDLFERAGTEGEKQAAESALYRVLEKIKQNHQTQPEIEMQFSLGNDWSRRLFAALCRRYGLRPFRYYRQRYTTVMLLVSPTFVDEVLWPEFTELDKALIGYLDSITNKIISEEVHGDMEEAEEVEETLALPNTNS